MPGANPELLRTISIFEALPTERLQDIFERCQWARYPRNTQIIGEHDDTSDVFLIVQGSVLAKSFSASGKEVTYTEIPTGHIFGEFSAIDGAPRSASVDTADGCMVARMSAVNFRRLLHENPDIGLSFCEYLVVKIRALTQRVFELSTLSVRHRIYSELVRLADKASPGQASAIVKPAPSHYEFATRIGTHREAVSREFSHLATLKIVSAGRREIQILDVDRLKHMVAAVHLAE